MRKTNPALTFLAMFIGLSLVFSSQVIFAQDAADDGKQIKVKIVQNVNGETVIIEKVFSADDIEAIEELLKEYDVNLSPDKLPDTGQIEISIRKTTEDAEDEDITVNVEVTGGEPMTEQAPKAFLGVFIESMEEETTDGNAVTSEFRGVRITEVIKETAAEKVGLQVGDVITKVNGQDITGSDQFREMVGSYKPGEEVAIVYQREGKENSIKAVLGENKIIREMRIIHPGEEEFEWHGMMPPMEFHVDDLKDRSFLGIVPAFSEESSKGVVIEQVIEKSTAQEIGLQKGDVIVEINDKPVTGFGVLREIISSAKVGDEVKVEWTREGNAMKGAAAIKSKAECKEICIKLEADKMAHCGEKWVQKLEYDLGENKEAVKEHLENAIQRLETELQLLKEQLQHLNDAADLVEELKVTITIEDVATNNLVTENLFFSPNPNNGTFNLSFELPEKGKTIIRIFDVNNKEIYEEALGKFSGRYEKQIDVSENPKGIYFLQITQNGKSLNKKIVIQ